MPECCEKCISKQYCRKGIDCAKWRKWFHEAWEEIQELFSR